MCYTLKAEDILLNYFAEHEDAKKISFQELGEISCRIVKKCNHSILSSITLEEIRNAAHRRSQFIKVEEASVILIDGSFKKFIGIYNSSMPERVKTQCIEICKGYVSK